jgi:hypothetical protein
MTVYFHGNFGLNREYMAGVLKAGLNNPKASGDAIAAPFGYKAPFTARYKSWLNKTGLITTSKVMELTSIGEVVWAKDPKFQSMTTQWLLHHELTGDPERAEAWSYFANDFIASRQRFSIHELQDGLSMKLMPHHPTHFGRDAPMIKVIARKIIQCYTQPEALGGLGFLSTIDNKNVAVHEPKQLGPWKSVAALSSAYK